MLGNWKDILLFFLTLTENYTFHAFTVLPSNGVLCYIKQKENDIFRINYKQNHEIQIVSKTIITYLNKIYYTITKKL